MLATIMLFCATLVAAHGDSISNVAVGGDQDALPVEHFDTSNCPAEGECAAQQLHLLQRGQKVQRFETMKAAAKKKREGDKDDEKDDGADEEDTHVEMDKAERHSSCHSDLTPNAAIRGHNTWPYRSWIGSQPRTVEWCINKCCETPGCKSVDYFKNDQWCDLSNKHATDSGVGGLKRDYNNDPYDHYDLPDCVWEDWGDWACTEMTRASHHYSGQDVCNNAIRTRSQRINKAQSGVTCEQTESQDRGYTTNCHDTPCNPCLTAQWCSEHCEVCN